MQAKRLTLWLCASLDVECRLQLYLPTGYVIDLQNDDLNKHIHRISAGAHCYFLLLDLPLAEALPEDEWIGYDLYLRAEAGSPWQAVSDLNPELIYADRKSLGFVYKSRLTTILHGSCRKPHHPSQDGLVRADQLLAQTATDSEQWPAVLILTGDQIYADDVAGPVLVAIHRLLPQLGLPLESVPIDATQVLDTLHTETAAYYRRQELLPKAVAEGPLALAEVLFSGAKKPIFTSVHARNHLMTVGEMLAMYLLCFSPTCWRHCSLTMPAAIPSEFRSTYQREQLVIEEFIKHLPAVARVLAHVPVAMIFDDHDVTDDWNLTLGWEQTAYQNPLSKRIIGNALMGYLICQGWGNAPEKFSGKTLDRIKLALRSPSSPAHDGVIDDLLKFSDWHYEWPTTPPIVVLDTRTHRWRSERSPNLPSGLMDWEALSELQQKLLDLDSVVMVSPAPVFGVKLIETIQRIFTWFGKPLMVDAEYWMAHSGAAYALLNMFHHSRTPHHFVILSGDVHYSFFYRVQLRGRRRGPDIWQITSSGISNEFPRSLIEVFDRFDRWLYAWWSPLNWFTKRREMKVIPHKPANASPGERLVNAAGLGLVELSETGIPTRVTQLCSSGEDIDFVIDKQSARWE